MVICLYKKKKSENNCENNFSILKSSYNHGKKAKILC